MTEPLSKQPKSAEIASAKIQKPKELMDGVTTVQIAGKDVFIKCNHKGVQHLHVASFMAAALNTDNCSAAAYFKKMLKKDASLESELEGLFVDMFFFVNGKKSLGIQFKGGIILLQNIKEKRANLDRCRQIVNDLLQICSGDNDEE